MVILSLLFDRRHKPPSPGGGETNGYRQGRMPLRPARWLRVKQALHRYRVDDRSAFLHAKERLVVSSWLLCCLLQIGRAHV